MAHSHETRLVRAFAAAIVLGATLVLVGWSFDIAVLKSGIPGLTAMNPLSALLFLLGAAALVCSTEPSQSNRPRYILAALITAGGLSCLFSYFTGLGIGLDRILFGVFTGSNRMAPNTAASFAFIGGSLLLLDARGSNQQRLSQALTLIVAISAAMSIVGYAYGAQQLYGIGSYIPMALNTAILFALLVAGRLAIRSDCGPFATLASAGAGGVIARRLLPVAVAIPVLLGLLRILGERAGWYDSAFGTALMVIVTVVLLAAAILVTAVALNRTDGNRQVAEAQVQLYADIVRHIPIGLTIWRLEDPFDNRSLRLVNTNAAASELLGVNVVSLCGQRIQEAFPAVSSTELETYAEVARTGECREIPRLNYGDDRVTPQMWSVKAFPLPDHCVGLAFENISERVAAEKKIREFNEQLEQRVEQRTAELERTNRDLSQKNQENEMFVYSVSHDLRSPLVSLQGFSKELGLVGQELHGLLASDGVPSSVRAEGERLISGEVQQCLKFIQSGVLRLSNIIDALLRLSRVGRVEYRLQPQDANEIANRVVEAMAAELYEKGVAVELNELPPCFADATALEQVFANLVGNALKYLDGSRKGEIEVGAVPFPPGGGGENGSATYFVRDNGLGISPAHHEKIFQAFQRVHPKHAPGEGMGLAIVRRIVERHGGRIWVESSEGQGSTFFVTLPNRAEAEVSGDSSPGHQAGGLDHGERANGHLVGGRR